MVAQVVQLVELSVAVLYVLSGQVEHVAVMEELPAAHGVRNWPAGHVLSHAAQLPVKLSSALNEPAAQSLQIRSEVATHTELCVVPAAHVVEHDVQEVAPSVAALNVANGQASQLFSWVDPAAQTVK